MRQFQLCGLGNAIVDIFVELSEEQFRSLQCEKGSTRLVELAEQRELLQRFQREDPRLVSGGSVANSVIGFSQLGGDAAFIGCVGDDRYGLFYTSEFEELKIDIGSPIIVNEATGTCVVLVTPDAERTMRTCLAVSSHLSAKHVDENRIKNSDWLFIEGYVFANPATGQTAIQEAIRLAKKHGTKVAITCSDAFIVHVFGDALRAALKDTDLFFCNEAEACAVTGATTAEDAFRTLNGAIPSVVVTNGPHGAYIRHGGRDVHVPAFACTPKDLTGAGDMFAGAFLYGITHGMSAEQAGRGACFLAHKVITQIGARLHHGTRQFWDEATSASSRRDFLKSSALALTSLAAGAASASADDKNSQDYPIVDPHLHLWDLSKFTLPWVTKDSPLNKSYLMRDFLEATRGLNVNKAVYMEVDVDVKQQTDEANHVLEICRRDDTPMKAAVISGRPASDDFGKYLDTFRGNRHLKGVRQVLHVPATPAGFCLQPNFVRGIRLLGERGLSFDLCMRPTDLGDAVKLVQACKGTRFILDHCGNGAIYAKDRTAWQRDMDALGKLDNVVCKISGIVVQARKGWTADDLAPVILHSLSAFGPDRVMFAGDWPVCTLAATYRQWVDALKAIVRNRPLAEQRRLFAENAARYYGL
jgi:predicted TIM-barrel fold metal-dependent hydrolase/sugar/nucleoside kinase (ribokinase family)